MNNWKESLISGERYYYANAADGYCLIAGDDPYGDTPTSLTVGVASIKMVESGNWDDDLYFGFGPGGAATGVSSVEELKGLNPKDFFIRKVKLVAYQESFRQVDKNGKTITWETREQREEFISDFVKRYS